MVSAFKVRCMRSWRPFCWGLPGSMNSGLRAGPPGRQLGQSSQGIGGKGDAVVSADALRQAELLEQAEEDRFGFEDRGRAQCLTAQQEATVAIGDRERIAIGAMGGFELTLEISAPNIVGSQDLGGGLARVADEATPPFVGNQAVTAQDLADGSSMRPMQRGCFLRRILSSFLSWGLVGRHPRFT